MSKLQPVRTSRRDKSPKPTKKKKFPSTKNYSPLNRNKFERKCDVCEKLITSLSENETHDCVFYLKSEMDSHNKKRETLTKHLAEADEDIDNLLNEYEASKEDQESKIDQLMKEIMEVEKENQQLEDQRNQKRAAYEERVAEEEFNQPGLSPNLAFKNFIGTASKDFTLFKNRLGEDFFKFTEKLTSEQLNMKGKVGKMNVDTEKMLLGSLPLQEIKN